MHQLQKTADPGGLARRLSWFALPLVAAFVADQWIKIAVFDSIAGDRQIGIPGILTLVRFQNFVAPASLPVPNIWLIFLGAAALFFIVAIAIPELRRAHRPALLGLALIIGGGISNLLDRIRLGAVRDVFLFLNLSAVNLADILLVIGLVVLLRQSWRRPTLNTAAPGGE